MDKKYYEHLQHSYDNFGMKSHINREKTVRNTGESSQSDGKINK